MQISTAQSPGLPRQIICTNENPDMPAKPYCAIGLSNPKSPSNVGSVVRACGCFSADQIFYTGIRYDRAEPFYTDTANRRHEIPLTNIDCLTEPPISPGVRLVCVELCENALPLTDYNHPEQAVYLFGPEDYSLSQETIDKADDVVFIPTIGCLNLSASVNLVLYDRMIKRTPAMSDIEYNDLIRSSRDCRNNLAIQD